MSFPQNVSKHRCPKRDNQPIRREDLGAGTKIVFGRSPTRSKSRPNRRVDVCTKHTTRHESAEPCFQMLSATTLTKRLSAYEASVLFPTSHSVASLEWTDLSGVRSCLRLRPWPNRRAAGARGAGLNATWTEAAPRRTTVMPLPNARISA